MSACSPEVAERCVAEVVAERDRLGQVLVQPQRAGDRARDLDDVQRVGEPDPVVVALRREEHLRLVLQPAERLGVHDPVAVALEARCASDRAARAARGPWISAAQHRERREGVALDLLRSFSGGRHAPIVAAGTDAAAGRDHPPNNR